MPPSPIRSLTVLALVLLLAQSPRTQGFVEAQLLARQTEDATDVHAADLDGDGDLDVLSASWSDDKIAWYENLDGQGETGPQHVITTAADQPWSVYAADLDGDGDQDVLSASAADDEIAWYENTDGLGSFGPQLVITNAADFARSVSAADVDGDGDLDVVSASAGDSTVAWYENLDGLGSFGGKEVASDQVGGARSVVATDLDGDGDVDLVAAADFLGQVVWLENTDGAGTFAAPAVVGATAGPSDVYAADLDGDGDADVLSSSQGDGTILWHENADGLGGAFTPHVLSSTMFGATSVFAGDLDDDGDADVLASAGFGLAPERIEWYENTDGLGSFAAGRIVEDDAVDAALPQSVFAADLDGDGDLEALTASFDDGRIAWYEKDGSPSGYGQQRLVSAYPPLYPHVVSVDLDGDGDRDLLASSDSVGTFTADKVMAGWWENLDGLGAFSALRVIAIGPFRVFATAADLDGDQDQDVLLNDNNSIRWFENLDGLGTFASVSSLVDPSQVGLPGKVLAVDMDGDGDQDVVATFQGDDQVGWYENTDGLGGFGPRQNVATGLPFPTDLSAADLDGDGDPDVVAGDRTLFEIAWYENLDGLGQFGEKRVITSAEEGWSVSPVDLDGDGDLDLVSASTSGPSDQVSWYENVDGRGHFGVRQEIDSATGAWTVSAADLDGDGDQDVLAGALSSSNFTAWYENLDGLGGFGPRQVVLSVPTRSVAADDLDGDGDPDLVLGVQPTSFEPALAWYENRACCGLTPDTQILSLAAGGTQALTLDAGPVKASELYWLLTTTSGATPGFALTPAPLKIPLNPSSLFVFTALSPNLVVANSLSFLDGAGAATASLTLPPGTDPGLAGTKLHHAYLVLDLFTLGVKGVSEATSLELVP